jgi:alkylhydroperoxidase family enzyme
MNAVIEPLEPPYAPEVDEQLGRMMPEGVPPILLFRTFARNLPMTRAMHEWGRYELGPELSLSMRDRELVIDRTCARCDCEYEWGVHVAFFAERVGLDRDQITSLTHGSSADACWTDERERILLDIVDSLHDSARLSPVLADRARRVFDERQLLDLFMLCGWYHAISYTANAAAVPLEDGVPRFDDHRPS